MRPIAKLIDGAPSTLRDYFKRRGIKRLFGIVIIPRRINSLSIVVPYRVWALMNGKLKKNISYKLWSGDTIKIEDDDSGNNYTIIFNKVSSLLVGKQSVHNIGLTKTLESLLGEYQVAAAIVKALRSEQQRTYQPSYDQTTPVGNEKLHQDRSIDSTSFTSDLARVDRSIKKRSYDSSGSIDSTSFTSDLASLDCSIKKCSYDFNESSELSFINDQAKSTLEQNKLEKIRRNGRVKYTTPLPSWALNTDNSNLGAWLSNFDSGSSSSSSSSLYHHLGCMCTSCK